MNRIHKFLACAVVCVSVAICAISCRKADAPATAATAPDTSPTSQVPDSEAPEYSISLGERLIYDKNGVKIRTDGLGTSDFGPQIMLEITNMTGNDIILGCDEGSVNGIMSELIFHASVPASSTVRDSIVIFSKDLELFSVEAIREIEFRITVSDVKSNTPIDRSDPIILTTQGAEDYEQKPDTSGVLLYEEDSIRISIKKLKNTQSISGSMLYLHIENGTDTGICVSLSSLELNGIALECRSECRVSGGKRAYSSLILLEADLKKNNVTDIQSVSLTLDIKNASSGEVIATTDILCASLPTFSQ